MKVKAGDRVLMKTVPQLMNGGIPVDLDNNNFFGKEIIVRSLSSSYGGFYTEGLIFLRNDWIHEVLK